MSNKKTIPTISSSEASKMSVSALAVRPNDASRFGQGGLSAKALQEWFDKLPNLVKEKFNEIAQTLASAEAAKYIGTDALGVDNLYDFLLLFGPRGTGLNDKNISDHIETLYTPEHSDTDDDPTASMTLKDIIADITARIVENTRVSRDAINYVDVTINEYGDLVTDYYTEGYGGNFVVHEFVLLSKNIGDGTITTEKLDQALNERIKAAFKDVSYIASTGQLVFKREADGNIVIDLPLELIVTSGRFDTNKNEIVLVLANGNEIRIPLDAVIGKITSDIEALKDSVKTVRLEGDRLVFESHRGVRNDIDLSSFTFDTASREKLDDLGRRVTNLEEHISDDYFVTDNSVAYEKAVPARACSSAKLASFGGMTYKSKNLFNPSNIVELQNLTNDGGVFKQVQADTYQELFFRVQKWKGANFVDFAVPVHTVLGGLIKCSFVKDDAFDIISIGLNGKVIDTAIKYDVSNLPNGTFYLSLDLANATQGSITFEEIMLSTEDVPYEPYYEGLRDSKVTEIKKHGRNRFNINGKFEMLSGGPYPIYLKDDKLVCDSISSDSVTCAIFEQEYPAGKYTFSANIAGGDNAINFLISVPSSGFTYIPFYGMYFYEFHSNTHITFTVNEPFKIGMALKGEAGSFVSVGEILLALGTVSGYKPYREPISYPIPAEIQAINGYGKDGFVIDPEKQTSAYEDRVSPLPVRLEPIIKVEGGGRLEFVNEYKNAVPSTVKYLLKEESSV